MVSPSLDRSKLFQRFNIISVRVFTFAFRNVVLLIALVLLRIYYALNDYIISIVNSQLDL